jgi:hypothetical protein
MDGAQARDLYPAVGLWPRRVGGRARTKPIESRPASKPRREAGWSCDAVQILVVVANIQMRTLKTEVEKGSM